MKQIDIHSGMGGNAAILSNLHPKPFIMDGEFFGSIEGFLQGLRIKDIDRQVAVFLKSGVAAKVSGRANPIIDGNLYYKGQQFSRYSDFYQELLDKAYKHCFCQCDIFQQAIKETLDYEFSHSIGKNDPTTTILTNDEFFERLIELRKMIIS